MIHSMMCYSSLLHRQMQLILMRSVFPMFVNGWHETDFLSKTPKPNLWSSVLVNNWLRLEWTVSQSVHDAMIKPATSLRNLGVWFDQLMTMSNRFGKVCSKAFFSLYNQRHMRKCLTDEACETLVHALVVCYFDFCKALLHDVSQYQQQSLQRVLNAAARLICRLPKYYHISPVLKRLSLAIDKTSRDL